MESLNAHIPAFFRPRYGFIVDGSTQAPTYAPLDAMFALVVDLHAKAIVPKKRGA